MDRDEFEKNHHFGENKSCATCWWLSWSPVKPEEPYKPSVYSCRLMQELGVPEACSVVTKPEDHSCGRYEA
jgi:hypothetical protein